MENGGWQGRSYFSEKVRQIPVWVGSILEIISFFDGLFASFHAILRFCIASRLFFQGFPY